MDDDSALDAVLRHAAEQTLHLAPTLHARTGASSAFAALLEAFVLFMSCQHQAASQALTPPSVHARDADRRILAVMAGLVSAADPANPAQPVREVPGCASPRITAFLRYLALEASLAHAQLDLAYTLLNSGTNPSVSWAEHPYVGVMQACEARILAFSGRIDEALFLLGNASRDGVPGALLDATQALAAGNAADPSTMRQSLERVLDANVPARDRLGRGVHLLLAFGADALGASADAVSHLLRAGGSDLALLTIIDRAFGFELLIIQAIDGEDSSAAHAWLARSRRDADHPIAAPTAARCEARVALLDGDPIAAQRHAARALDLAVAQGRQLEVAQAEMVLASAHIASQRIPDATQRLRQAVQTADRTGHHAVRVAASAVLRPVRRRLPPVQGGGSAELSGRETEILELLVEGGDNAAIADALSLSEATVRTHITRILTAYGVATRTGLLAKTQPWPDEPTRPVGLTPRQGQIIELLAQGLGNQEIAAIIGISPRSVETHVAAVRARWGATTRFDLALRWWSTQTS